VNETKRSWHRSNNVKANKTVCYKRKLKL